MACCTPTHHSKASFTQTGTALGSLGASGNVVVTLPVGYASTSSYVAMASHTDATAGLRLSVVPTSASTFTIYWVGGGATTQPFAWFTSGS